MKNKISLIIVVCLTVFAVASQISNKTWDRDFGVITSDVKGYYAYLPLIFIYDDLKVEHPEYYKYRDNHRIWYSTAEDDSHYIKFPMGTAILYSPFFFAAHLYASISPDYEADGFSMPYHIFLAISSIFYLIIGLLLLRKVLLMFFGDRVSAITLVLVLLGTNLWYYETVDMCMSHGYSFSILTLFMYTSIKWLEKPKIVGSLLLGLSVGLMVLIRPVDLIFVVFLLFFKIGTFDQLINRFGFFWKQKGQIILAVLVSLLVVLPQLIYWKYISGSFFFFSYVDEPFFFLDPNILKSMLSYRNGWLVYSPLMIFSLIGFYFVKKNYSGFFLFLMISVPLYVYVISSWWCWWYVGFGNRAFINLYPFLSIPLAAFVQFILGSKRKWLVCVSCALGFFLIMLSLFQTFQAKKSIIHYSNMTKEAYWESFGRKEVKSQYFSLLRSVDNTQAKKGEYCVFEPQYGNVPYFSIDFENVGKHSKYFPYLDSTTWFSPNHSYKIEDGNLFALHHEFTVNAAEGAFFSIWIKDGDSCSIVLSAKKSSDYYRSTKDIVEEKNGWKLKRLHAVFDENQKADTLKFYLINTSKKGMWVDDFQIMTGKLTYVSTPVGFFDF